MEPQANMIEKDKLDLHEAIEYGEIDEVKQIIRKFPSEKLFIINQKSALSRALRFYREDIYKLLYSKNFRFGSDEEVEASSKSKKKAFCNNLKNLKKLKYHYLLKLISKCRLTPNCQNDHQSEYISSIFQALVYLNRFPQIKVLLEILSLCTYLQIAFDFENDHIGVIDPRKDKYTRGCFHSNFNCITIGAKHLLDQKDCFEAYGTMAQEFCHCALNKIFKNDAKPYFKENTDLKNKYESVIDDCKRKKDEDEIISYAFSDETKVHAELIVRVPHILAAYHQNNDLLDKVKMKFGPLFDFYEKILQFMKESAINLRSIDARDSANKVTGMLNVLDNLNFRPKVAIINEFKCDFDTQKFQIYQSNCIYFTMQIMYEKLKSDKKIDSFIFTNLNNLDNKDVLDDCIEVVKCDSKIKLIIACETIDFKRIEELKETFFDFIIIANEILPQPEVSDMPIHQVSHKLSDLSDDSPIFKMKVNFQGTEIPLNNIFKECKEIIDIIPIEKIAKENSLRIGQEREFDINHVIRRYESPANTESLTYDVLINEAQRGKVIILSDAPRNGKTREFQYLAIKIKERFPFRWVIYIEMKHHIKSFSDQKHSHIFDSKFQLAIFFAYELLKLKNFEAEIFTFLFLDDRAVILLDEFDEVSPMFKDFMIKLIVAIKEKTQNMLWIATRPHLTSELKDKLNAEFFRMSGFDDDDRKLFLKNFLKSKGISDEDEIKNLLDYFEKTKSFWDNKIYSPFFLNILAEVLFENYGNYDMYKLHNEFVDKMFVKASGNQIMDVEEDMAEFGINIKAHYQKAALEMLWRDKNSKSESLIPLIFNDADHICIEKLNRIGLMYNDGTDFYFTDKSLGEFLFAQVICENLFSRKDLSREKFEALLNLFIFVINEAECKVIRMYIDMFLTNCTDCLDELMISKFSKSANIENLNLIHVSKNGYSGLFDFISFKLIQNTRKMREFWIEDGVAQSLLKSLTSESMKLHFKSFEDETITKILISKDLNNYNCLFAAAENKNQDVLEFFLDCAKSKLSCEDISSLFKIPSNFYMNQSKICEILERFKVNLDLKQFENFLKINLENKEVADEIIRWVARAAKSNPNMY